MQGAYPTCQIKLQYVSQNTHYIKYELKEGNICLTKDDKKDNNLYFRTAWHLEKNNRKQFALQKIQNILHVASLRKTYVCVCVCLSFSKSTSNVESYGSEITRQQIAKSNMHGSEIVQVLYCSLSHRQA